MTNPVIKDLLRLSDRLGSRKQAAITLGISPQYLSDILAERRGVSDNLAAKVGWQRNTTWRKLKGYIHV
jgi:plasmid maintenance system antidote protein VapI